MTLNSKTIAVLLAGALVPLACGGEAYDEPATETDAPMAEAPPSQPAAMAGLLNPNLADEAAMIAAGVSSDVAAAIVAGRPFMNMEEVDAALSSHMDAAQREVLYAMAWVPLNLNTASTDEIMMVPGVGERMTHEFEEYRPYTDMAQFRREMAKYVDDAEVDRLAQYVFVPVDLNSATREQIMALPGLSERMAHEFEEYRPYTDMDQFRREMGKYVDQAEVDRLARLVVIN